AFTQVTTLLTEDATWGGLGRGLLVLAVLWWAWASYAWLTNAVDAERGVVAAPLLVAVAAMFVAALAVPETFGRHPFVFAVAFLVVVLMHIALFALAGRSDPDLLKAILRLAPWSITGAALILGAGFVSRDLRPAFWAAAVAIGMFGPLLAGLGGWRVHAAHFAERH